MDENEFSLAACLDQTTTSSNTSFTDHSFTALHTLQQLGVNGLKRMSWPQPPSAAHSTAEGITTHYRDDCSRDSGISSMDSYCTAHFGRGKGTQQATTMPTDFSPLAMELGSQHGPTNGSLPFQQRSPATACESETDIVLSAKMGGTFNLLNTEKDNSDYLPLRVQQSQTAKHIAHNTTPYPSAYTRQLSAPLSKRPLQLRDVTNTTVSPPGFHLSYQQKTDGGSQSKLSRKRSSAQEKEKELNKRRKSNEQMFLHNHEGIPASVRSMPRVHSSSVLESSFDRKKHNPNSYGSPDPLEHYSLKTVDKPQTASTAFRSISADTLCRLLDSMKEEQFRRKFFLVDCRYPFEFSGGHIRHAVNIFDPTLIEATFYPTEKKAFQDISSRIPIFYCEFSQKRGPQMARELRRIDRNRNHNQWPQVDYKEIYILDYGYNKFFEKAKLIDFCEPAGYTPMLHPAHKVDLKQYSFHKHGTIYNTEHKGNKYFNGRKLSAQSKYSGSARRQMATNRISDFEADFYVSSFSISDSPVSSTSELAVCSSAHLPIRLARMTMQSPSSPAFPSKPSESASHVFQSRRMLFAAICEESSSSASSSASSSPPFPIPKPTFSPKYS